MDVLMMDDDGYDFDLFGRGDTRRRLKIDHENTRPA